MINYLKSLYKEEQFNPGFIGFWINPYFLIRRGLFKGIAKYSAELKGHLLDFGCGRKPYRALFHVDQYIGIDIEESGHPHERSEVDVFYDGTTIPFEDGHFDAVFSSEVFEHVFELDDVLTELHRVLKPKGKILFTAPFAWHEHEQPYDYARYTSFAWPHLLKKHGFEVIEETKSTGFVETVIQMWIAYWVELIMKKPILKVLLSPILVAPFTFLALVLQWILPSNKEYYHNLIILAEKREQ